MVPIQLVSKQRHTSSFEIVLVELALEVRETIRYGTIVDLGDVDESLQLAPDTVEKTRLLLDALLPSFEVMRQIRRQIAFEHRVFHAADYIIIWDTL